MIFSTPPISMTSSTLIRRGNSVEGGRKAVRPNSSGRELDYPTQPLSVIRNHLEAATALTGKNSVLFLWTIDRYLYQAEELAKSIGYKLHARMVWDKVTGIPAAFTVRYSHEYLLYMYRGKFTPVALDARGKFSTVFAEKCRRHSQKPEFAYQMIESLYPDLRKLEMYARNIRPGWDNWGNEIQNQTEEIHASEI